MPVDIAISRRAFVASAMAVLPTAVAAKPSGRPIYRDPAAPVADRVRDLLGRMTLEEKVAQMRCIQYTKGDILDEGVFSAAKAQKVLPEGIGQFGSPSDTFGTPRASKDYYREAGETVDYINAVQRFLVEQTRLGIPALFHEETAHGLKSRDATIFPIPLGLGSTWDPALVEQIFTLVGREARLRGATVALSPVLDLARDPRFGRVEEFFGEDPYLVAQMGIASVRGQQGRARPLGPDKIFTTLKHFVHGAPQGGLNTAPADMSERTLREAYLVPFEEVIKVADPAIIMPSYNELEGVPSHANVELLEKTGRQRLGFKGAYFSDYGGVTNLVTDHHVAEDDSGAAVLALEAGIDAELPDGKAYKMLPELVRAGRVSEARIDAAVSRVLALKFEAGLFENPYVDRARALRQINTPAAIKLARTAAQKALVLLKNDGVLPLDPNNARKLAVIGPNAVEPLFGGYSAVNAKAVGILDGIRAAVGPRISVTHAEGVRIIKPDLTGQHLPGKSARFADPTENASLIEEAVKVAQEADTILLVVGDVPEITRETISTSSAGDRSTLGLFGDQDKLVEAMIATGKPIIALLINGRPLAVTRLAEKANALVEGWYLGQEGGNAFADMLFGRINPGGKLTVTFPRSVGELPLFYNEHPSVKARRRYVEGKSAPLFPFGHGLSYTSFDLSVPRLPKAAIKVGEAFIVEVDVTNTGERAGDEVVQLYIRDDVSSVPRPVLELKSFRRVTLAPGEKQTLRFELGADALAFWNIDMNRVVEPGTFTLSTGPSSASLKTVKLTVTA
ncbi:beta-glucosidase [Sphingomonas sp. DBB INV C78]|uniref:glycoside hydrolase family 3 N-terminal domain-containing protein n=1 Tax=Sphingomonas sp. DBB INV C78 TaxID=3349434 RepID=UPI0036D3FBA9